MMTTAQRKIERSSPLPLYYQLKQILVEQIESGVWKPGELIPGEQELQTLYGLSRTTVRQALSGLEVEGRVIRQRGRGTFVKVRKLTHEPDTARGLSESIRASGMTPGWKLLSIEPAKASIDVAKRLGCAPGDSVTCVRRLRMADDRPLAIHTAYIAPKFSHLVDEALLIEGGSLTYLTASGQLPDCRAERLLDAVSADRKISRLLGVQGGTPMLRIMRLLVTADGEPVEDFCGLYRGDSFQYRVTGGIRLKV